jgi:hypothetical protein
VKFFIFFLQPKKFENPPKKVYFLYYSWGNNESFSTFYSTTMSLDKVFFFFFVKKLVKTRLCIRREYEFLVNHLIDYLEKKNC